MASREVILSLLSVFLLIGINAFFVTAEFSIVSVRRSRIGQLVKAGDVPAQTVQSLQRSIDRLLSTTQLGITLSSLALGWIGQGAIGVLVAKTITFLPLSATITDALAHAIAIPVAFLLIAYLQIVLGELCPKSVALLYSEQLARFFGPPSLAIARIFRPFIAILNQSTKWLLKLGGIKYTGQAWYKQVTPEELQLIIATERESTGLEAEEREILNNIFEFGELEAAEIMIPRIDMQTLAISATFKDLLEQIANQGYSRYPVIGDSLDDIRGIIDYKDLALALAQEEIERDLPIKPWVKSARFVSESTPLKEILALMQRSQLKMVIVVDRYGGTSGLLTRQDLIGEILGEEEEEIVTTEAIASEMLEEKTFVVSAQMNIEEVNERLGLELPVTDLYHTLGGFLLYQWQKIPTQGETLRYNDIELTVTAIEDNRLEQISIHRLPTANHKDLDSWGSINSLNGKNEPNNF